MRRQRSFVYFLVVISTCGQLVCGMPSSRLPRADREQSRLSPQDDEKTTNYLDTIQKHYRTMQKNMKNIQIDLRTLQNEQKAMDGELSDMISSISNPPRIMKQLQKDQRAMQAEASQIDVDFGKMKRIVSRWQSEMASFSKQRKPDGKLDSYAIYDGLVPIIKKMEVMAKDLIEITEKFEEQGSRYVDFGQSMLDSDKIDTAVNKRLCKLGELIERIGNSVTDTGEPIADGARRFLDLWMNLNRRGDVTLSTSSQATVKLGQQVVSNGDHQATMGIKLKKMCEKVKERAEKDGLEENTEEPPPLPISKRPFHSTTSLSIKLRTEEHEFRKD